MEGRRVHGRGEGAAGHVIEVVPNIAEIGIVFLAGDPLRQRRHGGGGGPGRGKAQAFAARLHPHPGGGAAAKQDQDEPDCGEGAVEPELPAHGHAGLEEVRRQDRDDAIAEDGGQAQTRRHARREQQRCGDADEPEKCRSRDEKCDVDHRALTPPPPDRRNACCITCDAFGVQAALLAIAREVKRAHPPRAGPKKGDRGLKQVDRSCGKRINHSAAMPQAGAVSCETPRRSARSAVI